MIGAKMAVVQFDEVLAFKEVGIAMVSWRRSRRRLQRFRVLNAPLPIIKFEQQVQAKRLRRVVKAIKRFGLKVKVDDAE